MLSCPMMGSKSLVQLLVVGLLVTPTFQTITRQTKLSTSALSIIDVAVPQAGLSIYLQHDINIYHVTYPRKYGANGTLLPQNEWVSMTGAIGIPTSTPSKSLPVLALTHSTEFLATEVPSNAFATCPLDPWFLPCIPSVDHGPYATGGILYATSAGYITLAPDGLGKGGSFATDVYPFVIAEEYAISVFNMYMYIKDNINGASDLSGTYSLNGDLYTAGFSEGGYGALAVHRASLNAGWQALLGASVKASFPAGGPYDLITQMVETKKVIDSYSSPSFFAWVIEAYEHFLGLEDLLNPEYESDFEIWFNGTLEASDVDSLMENVTNGDVLDVMSTSARTTLNKLSQGVAVSNTFTNAFEDNSFNKNWPGGSVDPYTVFLCHGVADDMVFYENALSMKDSYHNVLLTPIPETTCTNHADCGLPCLKSSLDLLTALPFTTTATTSTSTKRTCTCQYRGQRLVSS